MLKRTAGSLLSLALLGCGPAVTAEESPGEPACDPWAEVCEVALLPSWAARSVLDLEVARINDAPSEQPAEPLGGGQVQATIGRYLALQSDLDQALVCLLPDRFERLDQVPSDASVCDCSEASACWGHTALFGLNGSDDVDFEGAGLMLKTSDGDLYRGRILVADSRLDPAMLIFEYEGVM